jgi:hypothetical protein
MTREQLSTLKEQASRAGEIVRDLDALDQWQQRAIIPNGEVRNGIQILQDHSVVHFTDGHWVHQFRGPLLHRVVNAGIDALKAQLESELEAIGKEPTP